jgi:hypothetical protein
MTGKPMTIISKKQVFLAASAIAAIAGVALSMPNAVSAARLATYDFEFKFGDNTNGIGYIVVDKENQSSRPNGTLIREGDSLYRNDRWVDFSFVHSLYGTPYTYTKANLVPNSSYFFAYNPPKGSPDYFTYGSFQGVLGVLFNNGIRLEARDSTTNQGTFGYANFNYVTSFNLTERKVLPLPAPAKPVPVPAFALGIVAAGGWIASKQLRRQTKAVKQEVLV